VNYKFLSIITCNSDFKIFISDKKCHLPVNYKFLSVITCNNNFKAFINDQNCHLSMNNNFLSATSAIKIVILS
jgi:glutaredoxin-related protein